MAKSRPFGYYVVRAVRISGWLMLPLLVLYVCTGYALAEWFGMHRLLSEKTATALHVNWKLDRLLVLLLVVHAGGAAYLALRRSRWFRTRKPT